MIRASREISGKFFAQKQILKFQSQNEFITDDDILSLFLGLVRLIKKSTEIRLEEKYSREILTLKKEINKLKRF